MGLKNIEVEVRYKLGASPLTRFTVKVRPTDSLRKIKNHIVQSLDIEGKVMYREQNCDDQPTKRLSDCTTKKEEIFHVAAEKKLRDLKHHTVKLHLPEEFATQDAAELKIARTTTIGNLKHKLQDEYGIPVEEQNIHMLGQDTECQSGANIMQLHLSAKSVHLEVKWQRKEASPPRPSRVKRTQSLKSSCSLASGTPYAQAVKLSRRNSLELSSIHPKSLTKLKKKPGTSISHKLLKKSHIKCILFVA